MRSSKVIPRTTENGGYWGLLIAKLILISVIGILLIANAELLIHKNKFTGSESENEWYFGQVRRYHDDVC